MRKRHFVYGRSCTVCPFYRNSNFKKWRCEEEHAAIDLLLLLFCNSTGQAIAKPLPTGKFFSIIKVNWQILCLLIIPYHQSCKSNHFFPFDLANNKSRLVSSVIFDAPFKKSSRVSPLFFWPVTTIEVLSGIISPHLLGFKWPWPSPFRI